MAMDPLHAKILIISLSCVGGLLLAVVIILLICFCRKKKSDQVNPDADGGGQQYPEEGEGDQKSGGPSSGSTKTAEIFDLRSRSQRSGKSKRDKQFVPGNAKLIRGDPGLTAPILPVAPTAAKKSTVSSQPGLNVASKSIGKTGKK